MPEVFSCKDKKSNWALPFYMFQRKRMFYGPKEAIWNECEMLTRVVLWRIRNVNPLKRSRTSKVKKVLRMFKESFNESLKKMFLKVLNVTSNRICDMLVNHVMSFKRAYWMHKSWLVRCSCSRTFVLWYVAYYYVWVLKVKLMISNVFIGIPWMPNMIVKYGYVICD